MSFLSVIVMSHLLVASVAMPLALSSMSMMTTSSTRSVGSVGLTFVLNQVPHQPRVFVLLAWWTSFSRKSLSSRPRPTRQDQASLRWLEAIKAAMSLLGTINSSHTQRQQVFFCSVSDCLSFSVSVLLTTAMLLRMFFFCMSTTGLSAAAMVTISSCYGTPGWFRRSRQLLAL